MAIKVTRKSQLRELAYAHRRWERSSDCELYHVYGRYSQAKANAWEYCKELESRFTGTGLRIIGHNSCFFSCGFEGLDPETGELIFMYITASKDWYAPLTDIEEVE